MKSHVVVRAACLAYVVSGVSPVTAQTDKTGWDFSAVTVSAGEDPISSGITGIVRLKNRDNHRMLEVAVQHEQGWILYGRSFKLGKSGEVIVAASVSHFQGAPNAGPYLSVNLPLTTIGGVAVTASMLQWPGVFTWEPKEYKKEGTRIPRPLIAYLGSQQINVGPVGLVYSYLFFLNKPVNHLPGVCYTSTVRKDFSVSGSATRNWNDKKWMFYIGATWSPGT